MARSGMVDIVQRVRDLASAGETDYNVGATTYWDDDQIQNVLDECRTEVWDEALAKVPQVDSGGTARYFEYRSAWGWLEQTTGGTAVLYLRLGNGTRVGTAQYTPDYRAGRFTFAADTAGSAVYLTGRSYDVYAAAAMVWEAKAAHVADRFDFTADGAQFRASQMVAHYQTMAQKMLAKSSTGGVTTHTFVRDDVVNLGGWGGQSAVAERPDLDA